MKRSIVFILSIFLTVSIFAGCGKEPSRTERSEAIPVRVMKVELKGLDRTLEYAGNIKGQDEALVYPKVSGKIIEKVKEEGSSISKGEVIAYIDRDEVGLKFEKAPVESPLEGMVGRVYVDIGSSVSPQTPVALVTDTKKVEIELDMPERYLPTVSLGQEAEIAVDAYPEEKFIGRVTEISPVVDLQTRAAPIEILIDNNDRKLQSGMFAKVRLIIEEHKGVPVILKESILGKEPNTYVYVVEGKKAMMRKVNLGIREGPYFEVTEGLKDGDLVVIMGQQRLRDGSLVVAEE